MRKMKKLLSILVAATMTLAMAAPSFAAPDTSVVTPDGGFVITINNQNSDHTYEAYQIFKGQLAERTTASGAKVTILSNIEWGDNIDTTLLGELESDAVKEAESISENNVAQKAQAYGKILKGDPVAVSAPEKDGENKIKNYKITISEPGYYLIKDREGSIVGDDSYTEFIMQVVTNATANPKPVPGENIPEFEKTVGGKKGDDFDLTTEIPFELKATIPSAYTSYETYMLKFTDELSEGLDFVEDSVKLYVMPKGTTETKVEIEGYNPTVNGKNMILEITDVKEIRYDEDKAVAVGDAIVVTYNAKLNNKAITGTGTTESGDNHNKATLEYSNNPNDDGVGTGKSTDIVKVFTYKLDLMKVAKYEGALKDDEKTKLEGAKFTLQNADGEYAVVTNDKVTGWSANSADATELTSNADGMIHVTGLDAATYTLKETVAPNGYNLLDKEIIFTINSTIDADGKLTELTASYKEGADGQSKNTGATVESGEISLEVMNSSGAQLPSTGGIGTTIFYAAGIILMAGAVFFVVRRKRA